MTDEDEYFVHFFNAMKQRMTDKKPKFKDFWKNTNIKTLGEKLSEKFDNYYNELDEDKDSKYLVDIANQAMLLWIRKNLEVK